MWVPEKQESRELAGWVRIPFCLPSRVSSPNLPSLSGVSTLAAGILSWRGTTQLLEDNLSPLILSPMWWHSLTSTICWNTSWSSQRCAVSRTPLPCPITDRLLGGSSLPGGRDKDTAQHWGETHRHKHVCARTRNYTQTCRETPRDESKKTLSHRNLRSRVGGRDRESEKCGKRRNGRGECASSGGERGKERERNSREWEDSQIYRQRSASIEN